MRALVVGLVAAGALGLAACGDQPDVIDRGSPSGWYATPQSPLSPRHSAVAVRVGDEALFIGGSDSALCPPTADCATRPVPRRDGAAFDPSSSGGGSRWRPIAPAPVPVQAGDEVVVLGDVVYLLAHPDAADDRGLLISYDVSDDVWRAHSAPPAGYRRLVATDHAIVAYLSSHEHGERGDASFDPVTGAWSRLPDDPLVPSFDRSMVWAGSRLVLLAPKLVPSPGGADGPSWVRAATLDPTSDAATRVWHALPETREVISGYLHPVWDGARVLNPRPGGADGGDTNGYGRTLPHGGWLDPRTGDWEPLTETSLATHRGWGVHAVSPTCSAVGSAVFDAPNREWIALPRPPGMPDQGVAAVWVDESLVVWGGAEHSAEGGTSLSAAGAVWGPSADSPTCLPRRSVE